MEYHRFNIGKVGRQSNAWWAENIARGVITAGFDGSPGDNGEKHLRSKMREGDWVLAYVSGKGYVGAGRVLGEATYRLHPEVPDGTLSDHCHERGVKWMYMTRNVDEAISEAEAGLYHPVATRSRAKDKAAAERLIAMLRRRGEHLQTELHGVEGVTSAELVLLLDSLDAPIVVTKNKDPEWGANFRKDSTVESRYLDGFWRGRPPSVTVGHGYVLHHVVHESVVWLGTFGGCVEDGAGRFSYVMEAAKAFVVSDLGKSTPEQRALWAILKQPGPVVSDYQPRGHDNLAPTFVVAQTKRRLQQANFRLAVFALHGAACKVTGCDVPQLLDAAHLRGREWEAGHNAAADGIPLRADLHRAYDHGLIDLDEQHRLVETSAALRGLYDEYLHR